MQFIKTLLITSCCCLFFNAYADHGSKGNYAAVLPTAQCVPNFTTTLNANGTLTLTAAQINNGSSSDCCTIQNLSIAPSTFTCSEVGDQTVTLTVTEDSGATATCQTVVTIIPPEPNAMVCSDEVHISININCGDLEVTPDLILQGNQYVCMESYEVQIAGLPNNILQPQHLDQPLNVTITETYSGASCWGTVIFQDETPPIFTECGPQEILCIHDPLPVLDGGDVPNPIYVDCPDVDLVYTDYEQNGDCNGGLLRTINRVWTATDASGNLSQCTQTIHIRNVSLINYTVNCPNDVTIECTNTNETLDPERTGFPYVNIEGINYELHPDSLELCGLVTTYTDDTLARCGVGYELYRHWRIMDWCVDFGSANSSFVCTQRIKYQDTTAPTIQIPNHMNVASQGFNCGAIVNIPPATVNDCSDYTVKVITPSGTINGNGGFTPGQGLTGGQNLITYQVKDACGNISTASFNITVDDHAPPVAICSDAVHVSLSTDGFAAAFTPSFDEGSYDGCGIERMEVNRMDIPCNPNITTLPDRFVTFSCCDVAASPIMVRLKVFDFAGNSNECMVQVIVEDKIPPSIICPGNKVLDCDSDYTNLSITSEPIGNDNCSSFNYSYQDALNLSDCGIGTILRTWTATTPQNETASCVQRIDIVNSNPFNGNEDISWPNEYTAYGCGAATEPEVTGYPLVNEGNCSTVLASHHDQVFNFVNGVCYKIIRTWTVIDWCQPGMQWQKPQVIKVIDNVAPILENCSDRVFCNTNQECNMTVDLPVTIADDCIDVEDLEVTWVVDAFSDGIPDVGFDFAGTGQHQNRTYPHGTHRIAYRVADGCGNVTTCDFLFKISDCKAPTPVCINGLSISLMETGMVMVRPNMMESGSSFDNCSPRRDLRFSFSSDLNQVEQIYTCDDLGFNEIQLWVTDGSGNQAYCQSFVHVQDNLEACLEDPLDGAIVAGLIHTTNDEMLEGVEVTATNEALMVLTDVHGSFRFEALPMNHHYTIKPQKNSDPLNGVTTLDLILIKKHIIDVQPFTNPYEMIAADVNNSGDISSYDLVVLRKLILNHIDHFENNTSWRFISEPYEFLDSENPLSEIFPEETLLSDLDEHQLATNFIAIKIGDVNNSALPNGLVTPEDRNGLENLVFDLQDKNVNAGEMVTLDITAENISDVSGFQFTFEALQDALEIIEIVPSAAMNERHFGTQQMQQGIITVSWDNVEEQALTTILFSIKLRAKQAGQLSDWISINANQIPAEAYAKNSDKLMNVTANFKTGTMLVKSDIVVYQNTPNPFGQSTSIRFFLPQASMTSLTITDVSGKIVHNINGHFGAGMNEIKVNAQDMDATGVLFYRLETAGYSATRKMVKQ